MPAAPSDDNPVDSEGSLSGQSPQVVSACYAARAMWALGYPDTALDRAERASVGRSGRPAPGTPAHRHAFRRSAQPTPWRTVATQERAETVISLAEEYGLPLWLAFGHMNRGWARIAQDDPDGGIEEMRRGLSMYTTRAEPDSGGHITSASSRKPWPVPNKSTMRSEKWRPALAMVKVTGEYWCAAELHRIEGELVIMQAAGDEHPSPPRKLPSSAASRAEGCFREAIEIARRQQARSWELRASTSLGRLYHRQDKRGEARRVVQEDSRLVQRRTRHRRPEDGPDSK